MVTKPALPVYGCPMRRGIGDPPCEMFSRRRHSLVDDFKEEREAQGAVRPVLHTQPVTVSGF